MPPCSPSVGDAPCGGLGDDQVHVLLHLLPTTCQTKPLEEHGRRNPGKFSLEDVGTSQELGGMKPRLNLVQVMRSDCPDPPQIVRWVKLAWLSALSATLSLCCSASSVALFCLTLQRLKAF